MPAVMDRKMDEPEPERNVAGYLRALEKYVVETYKDEPRLTYAEIMDAADVERTARLNEFAFQKNYEMVDFILDGQPRIEPTIRTAGPASPLIGRLEYTQQFTKKTHPLEVQNDDD